MTTVNIISAKENHFVLNEQTLETNEITRRLTKDEKAALALKLKTIPQRSVDDLVAALAIQNWDAPIFSNPDFPYFALMACNQKLITPAQFGTIQLYWSALKYHGGKTRVMAAPLFTTDGKVDPEARSAIQETLFVNSETYSAGMGFLDPSVPLLSDAELDEFFERMKKLPLSEQQAFLVQDLDPLGSSDSQTVSERIYNGPGYNVFCRNIESGGRMIPSVGMMQEFLNVRFKESAVQINPVIGYSSAKDIRANGVNGTRDMAFHFPKVTLPGEADGKRAPWYDFTYHDFYHAILASGIPAKYRPLLIKVGDIVKSTLPQIKARHDRALVKKIYESFVDMEQIEFRFEIIHFMRKQKPEVMEPHLLFWRAVTGTIFMALAQMELGTVNRELLTSLYTKVAKELPLEPSLDKGFSQNQTIERSNLDALLAVPGLLPPPMIDAIKLTDEIAPAVLMSAVWQQRLLDVKAN